MPENRAFRTTAFFLGGMSGRASARALLRRECRWKDASPSMRKREPEDASATPDEIRQAFESLTKAELLKLDSNSRFRHQALGARRQGRDPDELVSDALLALLDGRRAWKLKTCSFFICLMGVIRSQSYHLRKDKPEDAFDDLEALPVRREVEADPLDERPPSTTGSVALLTPS